MEEDVRVKYILGNETMELAEQLGSDLFDSWLVSEIDRADDMLDDVNILYDDDTRTAWTNRKDTLQEIREAYHKLKK